MVLLIINRLSGYKKFGVMDVKFYLCRICGNLICKVVDSGVTPVCCGSEMTLLEPKSKDNGVEKHLPVVEWVNDSTLKVKVGSIPHPTTKEHHIVMIALETLNGLNIRLLDNSKEETPQSLFHCSKSEVKGVYAYCNLHGLWYSSLK